MINPFKTFSKPFTYSGKDNMDTNTDKVNHPAYYGGKDNPYEAIKVIDAWHLDFCLGNAVKYIARCDHKGSSIEDLEKAAWYLQREIELRKKKQGAVSYSDGKSEGN